VEVPYSTLLLALCAFWLSACPFSVWVGRWILNKDIRDYGDGNPGAANVFRAGGRKSGYLAVFLDVSKGMPCVALAHSLFGFSQAGILAVGLSAILGNAFSPLLRFKGGKSVAVTYGVLLALPQHEILILFIIFMFLGFLVLDIDAWTVMAGPIGSLADLQIVGASSAPKLFVTCLLLILALKHLDELKTVPTLGGRPLHWLQSRKSGV
jgi:glycerol-3-phosphate acyltransferase PlsY